MTRLWLTADGGKDRSSVEVDGVEGKPVLCESGLEGGDEDVEDVGSGGSGKLKGASVGVNSSAISSRVVCSPMGAALRPSRRCARGVVMEIGEAGVSSSRMISREFVEELGI